jgi:hypothetical protein
MKSFTHLNIDQHSAPSNVLEKVVHGFIRIQRQTSYSLETDPTNLLLQDIDS